MRVERNIEAFGALIRNCQVRWTAKTYPGIGVVGKRNVHLRACKVGQVHFVNLLIAVAARNMNFGRIEEEPGAAERHISWRIDAFITRQLAGGRVPIRAAGIMRGTPVAIPIKIPGDWRGIGSSFGRHHHAVIGDAVVCGRLTACMGDVNFVWCGGKGPAKSSPARPTGTAWGPGDIDI